MSGLGLGCLTLSLTVTLALALTLTLTRYDTEGYEDVLLPAGVSGGAAGAPAGPPLLPQLFGSNPDCAGLERSAPPLAPPHQPPSTRGGIPSHPPSPRGCQESHGGPGGAGAAPPRGGGGAVEVEVEAPAGERRVYSEAGYYAQAVYTPEQQARLGIDEHGGPAPRGLSARQPVRVKVRVRVG